MPLVEQELLTLPEHLMSPPVFSGVRVTRSLDLCVSFVDRCLSFCTFSFGHCVVCSSSIYGFVLPLWYLQTLLIPKLLPHACMLWKERLNSDDWWSTIPSISTKRIISSHLNTRNTKRWITTNNVENPVSWMRQAPNVHAALNFWLYVDLYMSTFSLHIL